MPTRYAPDIPLPASPYLPGETARPDDLDIPADRALAYGADCYNHGLFWEAHEAWEALWRETGDRAVQGLIQCAAACLKLRQGKPELFESIRARALAHLRTDPAYAAFADAFARFAELSDRPSFAPPG